MRLLRELIAIAEATGDKDFDGKLAKIVSGNWAGVQKAKKLGLEDLQSFIAKKLGSIVDFSFDADDEDLHVIFERDQDDKAAEHQSKTADALVKALTANGMSAHTDFEDGDLVVRVQYTHYDDDDED